MQQSLLNKLSEKKAVIGIVGLGHVGLPLSIRFASVGYQVIGFDNDKEKIENLNKNKSYISHIGNNVIEKLNKKNFTATKNLKNKKC